ncbi:hypothetical protein [Salinimicrobium sp. WS361]|uniref:hypothetical protein n=1 Tax=Salinimicrobium sp. WS361 TaxID=3425123 RepID=UPI003D6FE54E
MKATQRIIIFTIISFSALSMLFTDWEKYEATPCGKPPVGMRSEILSADIPQDSLVNKYQICRSNSELELLSQFRHRRARAIL